MAQEEKTEAIHAGQTPTLILFGEKRSLPGSPGGEAKAGGEMAAVGAVWLGSYTCQDLRSEFHFRLVSWGFSLLLPIF